MIQFFKKLFYKNKHELIGTVSSVDKYTGVSKSNAVYVVKNFNGVVISAYILYIDSWGCRNKVYIEPTLAIRENRIVRV